MMKRVILSLFVFFVSVQYAYSFEVPYLAGRVNDNAGIMSEQSVIALEKTLKVFEQKTSCQVVVLTVKSLEGENIEQYSIKVAEAWKLGQKGKDNGVLLLVSRGDRRMRIEVGYGLEATLTDFVSGRIIAGEIAPYFKNNDYDRGITNGINAIIKTIESGEYKTAGDNSAVTSGQNTDNPGNDIDRQVNDIPGTTRIIIGIFVFSVLGIFTFLMLFMKGAQGIFLYFFLIPFWGIFPMIAVGVKLNFIILGIYLIGTPLAKLFFGKTKKGMKISKKLGIFSGGTSGSTSSFRSSGSSFSSSSHSSSSGGGGSFGGGGSSGSW